MRLEDNFRPQAGVHSIYQPATDDGKQIMYTIGLTNTFSAPTRVQVLQRLTEFELPELRRVAGLDHERPLFVFWVNDGLEIEEAQYVIALSFIFACPNTSC